MQNDLAAMKEDILQIEQGSGSSVNSQDLRNFLSHGPPSRDFCLWVLQGYVNTWPSWMAVNRRFYNAECVILTLLVERI